MMIVVFYYNRWITLRLQLVGGLLVFFSALFAVLYRNNVSPGVVGLTMGYALQVNQVPYSREGHLV